MEIRSWTATLQQKRQIMVRLISSSTWLPLRATYLSMAESTGVEFSGVHFQGYGRKKVGVRRKALF